MEYGVIGFHVNRDYIKKKGATIEQNIEVAKKKLGIKNLKVVQIFLGPPRNFAVSVKQDGEESLKTFIELSGMTIVAHARYFCVPFSSGVKESILLFMQREWRLAARCGIMGIVLHLYRYPKEVVTKRLLDLDLDKRVKTILETPAISPDRALYNTPKALYELYNMTQKAGLNTGICIDTCHLYVSGVDLSDPDIMRGYMAELTKLIPPHDILIHLNDSASCLGCGKDKHASLGEGFIWKKNKESLKILLDFINKYKILTILERNEGSGSLEHDYCVIRSLS